MSRKIVVLGDIILDRTTTVEVRGMSPENDAVLVAQELRSRHNLGGAANVAANVKSLGGDVQLVGFGDAVVQSLASVAGIGGHVYPPGVGHNPVKHRFYSPGGHYMFRVATEAPACGNDDDYWASCNNTHSGVFGDYHAAMWTQTEKPLVVLVDYDKGLFSARAVNRIVHEVRAVHSTYLPPVLVDPGRHGDWKRFSHPHTIFKVNALQCVQHFQANRENRRLTYLTTAELAQDVWDSRTFVNFADAVRANLYSTGTEFRALIVTFGSHGAVLADNDANKWIKHYEAGSVPVADVCGAGDTFLAAVACHLAADDCIPVTWSQLADAVTHGIKAASLAVQRPGVVTVKGVDVWKTTNQN